MPILILDSKQIQVSKTNSDRQQPILELERERVNGSDAHLEIASLETTTKSIVYTYSESCITQSCIFRVVQVIKSLQAPLEVGNNLPGINDNVRERGLEQKLF